MKRILLSAMILFAAGLFIVIAGGASSAGNVLGTYKIELDNAFGLVTGADFKVAGVRAGQIQKIDLDQKTLHAVVTVSVTQPGFNSFHSDVFCQSRPQSLIGEYFVECQPGTSGKVLKPGSTIPVTDTQSTIPADLLANVMRMPYRERLTLIINELGAGVAGRSGDLQAALQRAVPALTETDNLLNLLANDSSTLQHLTVSSEAVITALANNSGQVQRFITEANNTATDTATQQANLRSTFRQLPGFLEQLRPALLRLGGATDANLPVLANLNAASGTLNRLLTDLPGFSRSALVSLRGPHPCGALSCAGSLGQVAVTGKVAVQAAGPTISNLNTFAKSTPELAQNLAIVLHDLDSRSRAVETDVRSPGGQGYTGLEALLQYVFNQTLAINTFGPFGHMLAVDAFVDPRCTAYATPGTIAMNLKSFGANYRQCYSWLGPNQPGVNETDPSNPSAKVPDPGGAPPGQRGPSSTASQLTAAEVANRIAAGGASSTSPTSSTPTATTATTLPATGAPAAPGQTASTGTTGKPNGLKLTLSQIFAAFGGSGSGSGSSAPASQPSTASSGGQAQQLLNYLLSP